MKHHTKILFVFGAFLISVLPSLASAVPSEERWPRWYVGLSGSLTFLQDADVSANATAREITFDNGWGVSGQIGYMPAVEFAPLNRMRFEAEVSYRANDVDTLRFTTGSTNGRDKIESLAYMVNTYYDVDTGTRFTPYLGGGIGFAQMQLDTNSGLGNTRDDEDTVFAYQLMAGVGYSPETIPQTEFSVGYRYFGSQDPEFSGPGTTKYEVEYDSHNIEAGAKFRF